MSRSERLYETWHPTWRKLRQRHLDKEPLCRVCRRPGKIVDHVNGRADRLEDYEDTNLQTMCWPCHNEKTNAQREGRTWYIRGALEDGTPRNGWRC